MPKAFSNFILIIREGEKGINEVRRGKGEAKIEREGQ